MRDDEHVLRVGLASPMQRIGDPHCSYFSSAWIHQQVFEAPLRDNLAGTPPEPLLFSALPSQVDERTWRAELREGLCLSDGTPLGAGAIAAALLEAPGLADVAITAADGVLTFQTSAPEPDFLRRLASPSSLVAVRSGSELLGTGPYRLVSVSERRVLLERNDHHAPAAICPQLEFVVFERGADGNAQGLIDALTNKEIDLTCDLSRDEVERVQSVRRTFRPGSSTAILAFNCAGALSSLEHRQALAAAIDRQALTALCYQNPVAYTARGLIPPQLGRYPDSLHFDPDAARSLLAASPIAKRLRMLVVWAPRPYLPQPAAVAQAVAGQLAAVGVAVEIEIAKDVDAYFASMCNGHYDLSLGGWIGDTPLAVDFFYAVLGSDSIPSRDRPAISRCNLSRIADPELDAGIERMRRGQPAAAATALMRRFDALVPLVPLMVGPSIAVHSWRVHGFPWDRYAVPPLDQVRVEPSG